MIYKEELLMILCIENNLRKLTWKKYSQIKLPRLRKVWYEHLSSWYINFSLYKRFLYWNKIFKNKVVTGKTWSFVIHPFCTPHSICLNLSFWQSSFVWKYYVFNLSTSIKKACSSFLKKFSFSRKYL